MKQEKARKSIRLQDIAQALGVSRTTVSNAFNRPDQLSPQLRDRILKAAKDMGYAGPNPMARMLRTGKTGTVGLVFSESLPYAFSDPVAIAFLQGVSQVCEKFKASLLIVPTLGSNVAPQTIQQAVVDGFILYCMPNHNEAVARVLERQLPVVTVDHILLEGVPSVSINERQGASAAATHLLELNHQRLAIISLDLSYDFYAGAVDAHRLKQATFENVVARLQGYQDAIAAAGIDINTVPIEECPSRNGAKGAYAATMRLLQQQPRPTGILAMSDILALGALRAAQDLGLKIPEDLSIVGFDDTPLASQIRPTLTTIQQPLVEKGVIAAELLLNKTGQKTSQILETKLIIRSSSAIAPLSINTKQ